MYAGCCPASLLGMISGWSGLATGGAAVRMSEAAARFAPRHAERPASAGRFAFCAPFFEQSPRLLFYRKPAAPLAMCLEGSVYTGSSPSLATIRSAFERLRAGRNSPAARCGIEILGVLKTNQI